MSSADSMSAQGSRRSPQRIHRQPASSWTAWFAPEGLVAAGLLGLLATVPLGSGSQALSGQAINALVAATLALGLEGVLLARRADHPVDPARFALPGTFGLLGLAWVVLQTSTWLPSSWAHPAWQMAAEVVGQPLPGRVSVDPDLTAQGTLRLLTAGLVFWVACQLSALPARAYALLTGLVVIEIGYGLYGLATNAMVSRAGGPVDMSMSSTFANRNTYATYAGLGALTALALTWRRLRHSMAESGSSARLFLASLIAGVGGMSALWVAATIVLTACVMLSASRGGAMSFVTGVVVLSVLTVSRRKRSPGRGRAVVLTSLAAGLAATAVVLALFGDPVLGRLATSGIGDQGRRFIFATSLDAILASPWLGYGYGTFASVFPMFNDGSGDAFVTWDLAHNTYIEILLGCGIPGGLVLIAAAVVPVLACTKGALRRDRDATLPALAASASALVGLHAFVDYSLQFQGVALTYAVILGIGFAQARAPRSRADDGSAAVPPFRQPPKAKA